MFNISNIKTISFKIISFILSAEIFFSCQTVKLKPESSNNSVIDKKELIFKAEPDPFSSLVELETKYGKMKIELFFEQGEHRANFLKLAKNRTLDSTIFHRVIKNFMIQGGDPTTKNAKPGQRVGANSSGTELFSEINNKYYHIKGALAAARQPDEVNPEKKSSGSQFYIVHGSPVNDDQLDKFERELGIAYSPEQRKLYKMLGGSPQLDMNYTVFGRVYEGYNVIDSIAGQMTDGNDRPQTDIKIALKVIKE